MKKIIFLLFLANILFAGKETFAQYNHDYNPAKYLANSKATTDEFNFDDVDMNEATTTDMKSGLMSSDKNFNPFKDLSKMNEKLDMLSGNDFKIYTTGEEAITGSKNVVLCISLQQPAKSDYMVPLDFTGSNVTNGVDFIKIPEYVIFRKGEQNQCMIIKPLEGRKSKADGLLKIRARTSASTFTDLEIKIKSE